MENKKEEKMNKKAIFQVLLITFLVIIGLIIILIIFLKPNCTGAGKLFIPGQNKMCCSGLKTQAVNSNTITIKGECYTFFNMGNPTINMICMNCGDGECEIFENKCNCAQDCSDEPFDYNSISEFCNSEDFDKYCGPGNSFSGDACDLC